MSETIMHPADPDDPSAIIADLEDEIAELREQVATADAARAEALAKMAADHAKHLEAIAHGDCIGVRAHKAALAELKARFGK